MTLHFNCLPSWHACVGVETLLFCSVWVLVDLFVTCCDVLISYPWATPRLQFKECFPLACTQKTKRKPKGFYKIIAVQPTSGCFVWELVLHSSVIVVLSLFLTVGKASCLLFHLYRTLNSKWSIVVSEINSLKDKETKQKDKKTKQKLLRCYFIADPLGEDGIVGSHLHLWNNCQNHVAE